MKNNLRLKIHDTLYILKKKDYLYIFISLLLFDIYAILDSSPNAKIFENLIYNYNDYYYVGLLVLLTLLFSTIIVSRYKNRIEITTRFEDRKEGFWYIFKKVVILITFIYIINFILIFVMTVVKNLFVFENKLYYLYNVPISVYFLWTLIKDYIYLIYISYLIIYIDFYYDNKIVTNASIVLSVISILIPIDACINNSSIKLLFISSFMRYKNYLTIFNEILYFICSIIVKLYLISFVFYIINMIKMAVNMKFYIYKLIDKLHMIYIPLCIYIIVNILNYILSIVYSDNINLELLSIDYIKNLSYINIAAKSISIFCLVFIVAKIIHRELSFNNAILFTRISKKKWFSYKIIIYSLLFFILRLPIYIYLRFSIFCIYDLFIYIYLLINLFDYLKENNYLNLYAFLFFIVLIIIIKINIYSIILLLVLYLIKCIIVFVTKKQNILY